MSTAERTTDQMQETRQRSISGAGIALFALELALVVILAVIWFRSDTLRESRNLWVLFFYSFPSQFVVAIAPHEPVFLYFSKFHAPLAVTLAAVTGTVLTEMLNYSVIGFVFNMKTLQKVTHSGFVKKFVGFFEKAPFVALLVAGFTPIPLAPFRVLVVLARYPLLKYVLAVFISRSFRFYLLAVFGHLVKVPNSLLITLFVGFFVIAGISIVKLLSGHERTSSDPEDTAQADN